jgi:hypothetical protein
VPYVVKEYAMANKLISFLIYGFVIIAIVGGFVIIAIVGVILPRND